MMSLDIILAFDPHNLDVRVDILYVSGKSRDELSSNVRLVILIPSKRILDGDYRNIIPGTNLMSVEI